MLSETLLKFSHPETLVKEYRHWLLLLKLKQVTLGSLVLVCNEEAGSFSHISNEAFAELPSVIRDIEKTLQTLFHYQKINYLMLMMVDPYVHFHIIPRYSSPREFEGISFQDKSWPNSPDLGLVNEIDREIFDKLVQKLKTVLKGKTL